MNEKYEGGPAVGTAAEEDCRRMWNALLGFVLRQHEKLAIQKRRRRFGIPALSRLTLEVSGLSVAKVALTTMLGGKFRIRRCYE